MTTSGVIAVPVDGGSIQVTIYSGALMPAISLLCVHGWTLDQHSFDLQRVLAQREMVVATFDRRGFGASPLEPDFARELDDLSKVTRALPGRVIVYGVSQGARLALRAAALGSIAPAGLILQGGHLDGYVCEELPEETIPFDHYRACFASGEVVAFQNHWGAHPLIAAGFGEAESKNLQGYFSHYRGLDLLTPNALPTPMDLQHRVRELGIPIMTVVGSLETRARRAHAAEIERLTGAHRLIVEGGGHLCHLSHPDRVNAGVLDWCAGVSARARDGVE